MFVCLNLKIRKGNLVCLRIHNSIPRNFSMQKEILVKGIGHVSNFQSLACQTCALSCCATRFNLHYWRKNCYINLGGKRMSGIWLESSDVTNDVLFSDRYTGDMLFVVFVKTDISVCLEICGCEKKGKKSPKIDFSTLKGDTKEVAEEWFASQQRNK